MLLLGPIPFTGDPAHAEERVIMILQTAYFPSRTAFEPGDTLRFVNVSGQAHTVSSSEGIWTTGAIEHGDEITLKVDASMAGRFHGKSQRLIEGRLDLARTPLTR
ncbi:hypothetical protein [uncultured Roseobacter sp.]|uniref:cupredoxin domain-containing protein n=2 Tax=uncultured Roseobacter sp. TaxID=114847 RepID=UPI00262FA1E2|nr:hypothetical protein [uncultured Roseobacter sp.]